MCVNGPRGYHLVGQAAVKQKARAVHFRSRSIVVEINLERNAGPTERGKRCQAWTKSSRSSLRSTSAFPFLLTYIYGLENSFWLSSSLRSSLHLTDQERTKGCSNSGVRLRWLSSRSWDSGFALGLHPSTFRRHRVGPQTFASDARIQGSFGIAAPRWRGRLTMRPRDAAIRGSFDVKC